MQPRAAVMAKKSLRQHVEPNIPAGGTYVWVWVFAPQLDTGFVRLWQFVVLGVRVSVPLE